MIIQCTVDVVVPRLVVDGIAVTVDDIKQGPHQTSEVFVDGFARRHLLPDWFLPGIATPQGTIRTGGHTFRWERTE